MKTLINLMLVSMLALTTASFAKSVVPYDQLTAKSFATQQVSFDKTAFTNMNQQRLMQGRNNDRV